VSTTTTGDSILPQLPDTPATVSLLVALSRCDYELAAIAAAPENSGVPAFLSTLGEMDWRHERGLILGEIAALAAARKEDL
jgi:hypothetical protein